MLCSVSPSTVCLFTACKLHAHAPSPLLHFWWISSATYRPGMWTTAFTVIFSGSVWTQIFLKRCRGRLRKNRLFSYVWTSPEKEAGGNQYTLTFQPSFYLLNSHKLTLLLQESLFSTSTFDLDYWVWSKGQRGDDVPNPVPRQTGRQTVIEIQKFLYTGHVNRMKWRRLQRNHLTQRLEFGGPESWTEITV